MGKKKTSIYVEEDTWQDWMIFTIKEYGSSRKASEALDDAMKFYMKPIYVQDLKEEKVNEFIENMKDLLPDLTYFSGSSRSGKEGYVGMYYIVPRDKA